MLAEVADGVVLVIWAVALDEGVAEFAGALEGNEVALAEVTGAGVLGGALLEINEAVVVGVVDEDGGGVDDEDDVEAEGVGVEEEEEDGLVGTEGDDDEEDMGRGKKCDS